jgi:phosphoribosylaminoimidazole carboxylase
MNTKIGILGGGQLAMMLTEASIKLGYRNIFVLDPTINCPAKCVGANQVVGSFKDENEIINFAKRVDVLTFDIESVNLNALYLAKKYCNVYPDPSVLDIIQDKYCQKKYLKNLNIPIPELYDVDNYCFELEKFIVKTKKDGYDGKGVWVMKSSDELSKFMLDNNVNKNDIFIEDYIEIKKELAVIAYLYKNKVCFYPIVETIQENGICKEVICPTPLNSYIRKQIKHLTKRILLDFNTKGVFAIEFLYNGDEIYVNEISPRVHNSGHYTIEATNCSQFEQHMRSILDLECIQPKMTISHVKMTNVLGTGKKINKKLFNKPNFHWYHKKPNGEYYKKNRKIGHYTKKLFITEIPYPLIYIVMGSSSDLPYLQPGIDLLKKYNIPIHVDVVSAHRSPHLMYDFGEEFESKCGKVIIAAAGGAAHLPRMLASITTQPVIGVPIPTKHLGGQDSLYSIVQMPDGVPVATVGIGKSKNASILAMKILNLTEFVKDIKCENGRKVGRQMEELGNEFDNFYNF